MPDSPGLKKENGESQEGNAFRAAKTAPSVAARAIAVKMCQGYISNV
jgi:hypothetical protein